MLYLKVSTRLSDSIDVIIYIFLQPDVRKLLLIKLSCGLLRNTLSTHQVQQQSPSFARKVPENIHPSNQGRFISKQIQTNNGNDMLTTEL